MTRRLTIAGPACLLLAGVALFGAASLAAASDRPIMLAQGAPLQLGPASGPAPGAAAPSGGPPRVAPVPAVRPSTDSPTAPAMPQPPGPAAAPAPAPTTTAAGPLTPPVRRQAPRAARGIDADTRDIAQQVNAYFNGIRFMQGDFVQVGPDGRRTTGKLYLDKPGKIRFQYNAPSPVEIIADGQSVAVRDRRLNTQDIYPLSQTPLRFLLSDRVDILRDANVTSVTRDPDYVIVMLEERQAIGGTNRLMILFNANDFTLRQWTVFDAQGYETSVAVHNLDTSRRPDQRQFRINYERILQ
ncbi:outer-membrane lipoprotein carrier protein LolA [Phreatobacter stygius]|uniref:Outer membrane lipoprotein carrier protein LolA n=1 Tax=Phreatobacter stygius TaxID=1940610 RepID=A0A4D7B161_9HYPH|nr:outer-membrane lipoprotein carrier protein LolA [Phreatobacter stygius]QCI64703.1 outer membrane lipoprotein carrier protein LolA [Phreatobacter stygius]